jgi:DNA primase
MNATASELEFATEPAGRGRIKVVVLQRGQPLHVDTVDASSARSRRNFLDEVIGKFPGLEVEALEAELLTLAAPEAGEVQPPAADHQQLASELLAATPPEVIAEAEAILADPDLVGRVCDAATAAGVAGERELVLILYLIGTSRLLARPLAGIVQGSSSSGKSYTVDRVASLFPPEALIRATQMTPQALFHMPPGALRHKWVVAGERSRLENDDTAEATRALREMLSGQRLSKLMPVKTGNTIETALIEQEGPIAFTETTTLAKVFEEDANRCLLLQTDESPEQTRRIVRAVARRQSGAGASDGRAAEALHALQRLLPPAAVVVPWAGRLGDLFDCSRVEVRRAFPQLLALVQASALLHHRQRRQDSDGAVVADANDYHVARRLIAGPFAQSLGGSVSQPALDFLARLRYHSAGEFTVKEAAKALRVSKSSASGWVAALHDAGALEVVEEARGRRPAKWRVTGADPEPGDARLPTTEQLFAGPGGRVDATAIHWSS